MADTTSTTQFKADISQLKSAMQQAQRAVKLANSEFKAASSGMDDWSTNADGLRAKLKQLTTVLDSQKTRLSLLEEEYEKTKEVYGENSAEADKVKISINNMKAAINNTEKEIKSYNQDLTDCENQTGKFADETEDSVDSMEEAEEASANLGDGFTVMKGVMADLISSGIKALISGLKDLAESAYEAYQEFDNGYDIIVAKTGTSSEALEGLTESYGNVMKSVITDTETAGSAIGEINTKFGLTGEELEDLSTKFIKFADLNNTDVVSSIDSVQSACEAWGIESENVGDLLDLLNSASQKTGASVDSLASSLTTNAASLKDMNLNVDEAVTFMGKLETSGVDAETVMAALKKALANSAKEGKSTADTLSELQEAMESADSTSEATVAAMELFGTKAGPAIAEACKSGRLDFNDLSDAMSDYQGNVEDTYEETLDGVDKIKLAWQGVKADVGSEISSMLTEYEPEIEDLISTIEDGAKSILKSVKDNAPQIKDKIKDVIEFAKSGITFIITNFDTIKETIKNIGTILAATFVASKLASFVSMIGTMISTFAALRAATEAAETAQLLLNAAQMATPIGLVTAGVAALASAIILVAANTKSYTSDIETLTSKEQEEIDKIYDMIDAYDEVQNARSESLKAIDNEYDYYEQLAEELDSYTNSAGEVNQAYQERANFIVTTLNDALGTEMELVDGVIQNYKDEKTALEELIETKKAQAILSANEEAYTTAIQNQEEALNSYASALSIYNQNKSELADLETKFASVQSMTAEEWANQEGLAVSSATAAEMYGNELVTLTNKINGTKGAMVESKTAYLNAENQYIEYQNTIKNYEGLSSAIISGDTAKIKEALENMENDFITAESGTRESLERQVSDMETNYQNLKEAVESGSDIVTQEMVDAAKSMVDSAVEELNKFDSQASSAGDKGGKDFVTGMSGNTTAAIEAAKGMRKASEKELEPTGDSKKSGENFGAGYIEGINSKDGEASSSASNLGTTSTSALSSSIQEGSPSRLTQTSGENFGQGFINGMNNKTNSVWTTAWNLAKTALNALKSGQQEGSPSKLTYQSGKYFTQGYINGISSQQKNLVKTVKNLVGAAVKEVFKVSNYQFSEAGASAAEMLADKLSAKTNYMVNKMTYQNEKKLAEFDKEITKIETRQNKAIAKIEQQRADKTAQIQNDSTAKLLDLEQAKQKTTDKNEKAKIDKKITAEKENAKKLIAASDASFDKQIAAEKTKYAKLIAIQNKYKTAYQDASVEMISEFTEAINNYSSKAQDLINTTLNGIGDKFQAKYDELVNKQDILATKLKSAGELFSISGAGVMTVNDITEQTKQIKDYASKLQKIKDKVSSGLFDEIASYDMKEGNAFMDRLLALSDADLKAYSNAYDEKMATAEQLAEKTYKKDIDKVAEEYNSELNKALASLPKQLEELGNQSMKGFVEGLTKNTDYMSKEVKTFVKSMVDNFKKELKISSPSKVMEVIGDYTGEGLIDGLKGTLIDIKKTAQTMAQTVATPLDNMKVDLGSMKASIGGSGSVGQTTNVINNYNLTQNNTSPKSLSALETYQARRQQVAMVKAMT
jgi:phage-related minor tail protein